MNAYFLNVLIATDQWWNALLGGDPGQTISFRAGVAMSDGRVWACILCRFLDLFEQDHCAKTIANFDGEITAEAAEIAKGEQPT